MCLWTLLLFVSVVVVVAIGSKVNVILVKEILRRPEERSLVWLICYASVTVLCYAEAVFFLELLVVALVPYLRLPNLPTDSPATWQILVALALIISTPFVYYECRRMTRTTEQ